MSIDHHETAIEMLKIADEHCGWLDFEGGEVSSRERWAIQQHNLAGLAHAVLALVEVVSDVATTPAAQPEQTEPTAGGGS